MSVVIYDTLEQKMWADTVASSGLSVVTSMPKVFITNVDDKYSIMVGGVGVNAQTTPATIYAIKQITHLLKDDKGFDGMLGGLCMADCNMVLYNKFCEQIDCVNKMLDAKCDFGLLIAVKCLETEEIAIGILENSPEIQWGVRPLYSKRDIVMAGNQVENCILSLPDTLSPKEKIAHINHITFIGTPYNTVEGYSFDGTVEYVKVPKCYP